MVAAPRSLPVRLLGHLIQSIYVLYIPFDRISVNPILSQAHSLSPRSRFDAVDQWRQLGRQRLAIACLSRAGPAELAPLPALTCTTALDVYLRYATKPLRTLCRADSAYLSTLVGPGHSAYVAGRRSTLPATPRQHGTSKRWEIAPHAGHCRHPSRGRIREVRRRRLAPAAGSPLLAVDAATPRPHSGSATPPRPDHIAYASATHSPR